MCVGILERTRALLVATLGPRIKELSADERGLKDLILVLDEARVDIERGLEALRRDVDWLSAQEESQARDDELARIEGDMKEGEDELGQVKEGIVDTRKALAAAQKKSG